MTAGQRVGAVAPVSEDALRAALERAEAWSEDGYTETSKAYWSGIRDTLRVVLGITTEAPTSTGPDCDVAALEILGAQHRYDQKRTR